MLTNRDKQIIFHIEKYGFLTIGQANSIWFSDRKYGYDLARKHLNKCVIAKQIKSYKPVSNIYAEKIFYIESKYSRASKSMIIAMDVYSELIRQGADMIYFKREENWFDGKYRSDAFTIVAIANNIYSACIEVIDNEKLTYTAQRKHFISKYEEIYEDDEPLKKLMEITNLDRNFTEPKLIVIAEILPKDNLEIDGVDIIFLDYSLQKLNQIFTTKMD
ncbi:MAG TPA: hypothetical protein VIK86_05745 [Candidatus Paceibacterota bacterium]